MKKETEKLKNYRRFTWLISIGLFLVGLIFGFDFAGINDKKLNVLIQAYKYLLNDWYEGVEDEEINIDLAKIISSMTDDRNTYYTSTIKNIDDSYSAGFGFSYYYYNKYPCFASLEPNSPIGKAESQGQKIDVGDYIIAVNGISVQDQADSRMDGNRIRALFKSTTSPDEIDTFLILKKGSNDLYDLEGLTGSLEFKIQAGRYEVETAKSEIINSNLENPTALLTLTSFELNTASKVYNHLTKYKQQGIRNLIIDLRDNPGGFIDSVVEIADYFLPKGAIISIFQYKDGSTTRYKATRSEQFTFDNFFILTNGYSASASEMLTGALVDNDIAIQVGEKTYGKGSAQKTVRLGIDEGQLTYTYAVWTTIGRDAIHKVGITPEPENIVAPVGYYQWPFPDYKESYSDVEEKQIIAILGAIGYNIIEGGLIANQLAVDSFRATQGLPPGEYDFDTYIKLSNFRINNRNYALKLANNHCLEAIYG